MSMEGEKVIAGGLPPPASLVENLCEDLESVTLNEPIITIPFFPGFEKFEGHMNWIYDSEKFTESAIQTIINVIIDKVNENTQDGDATLKYFGIESVCFRAALAFLSGLVGQHNSAQMHLIDASQDIKRIEEKKYIEDEYLHGLRYVLKGLNAYNYLQRRRQELKDEGHRGNDVGEDEIQSITSNLDEFDKLSTKSQVGVMAARSYFDGQLRRPHEPQIEFIKQMIEKDPENYLWHFNLYSQFRFQRREKDYSCHTPTENEVRAINRAIQLAPEHPLVLVGDCVCLAETMRSSAGQEGSWRKCLTYGDREFKSMQAVVDTIKIQTKKILETHQETVRVNVHISECFSLILPQEYRDLEFAKQCVERALKFHPHSSKAHHRMGTLLLNPPNCDMKQVIQYYENAVTCDPRNFPAKVALIRSLMYSPIENYEKIELLLDEELANPGWNDNRKAELHFLKGCFLLLTHGDDHSENDIGAALEWLKTSELCPTVLNFVNMYTTAKRFNWPQRKLSYATALAAVESLGQSGRVDASNANLQKIRKMLQKKKEAATLHYQQQQQARGGGNSRGANRGGGRGGRQLYRRNTSDDPSFSSSSKNGDAGKENRSREDTRPERTRRWSASNSNSDGAKVIAIRQPLPPNGPGFSARPRQLSISES